MCYSLCVLAWIFSIDRLHLSDLTPCCLTFSSKQQCCRVMSSIDKNKKKKKVRSKSKSPRPPTLNRVLSSDKPSKSKKQRPSSTPFKPKNHQNAKFKPTLKNSLSSKESNKSKKKQRPLSTPSSPKSSTKLQQQTKTIPKKKRSKQKSKSQKSRTRSKSPSAPSKSKSHTHRKQMSTASYNDIDERPNLSPTTSTKMYTIHCAPHVTQQQQLLSTIL